MEIGYTLDQAAAEAARCLLCHEPPCSAGCPASTDPGRFIRQLRMRNLKGAAATIKRNNPLGGVCAVLCPTCELCASGCTAEGLDRPIEIGKIQRFLVEHAWEIGFNPLVEAGKNGIKVAVVGSGPSGLCCAAELARGGFSVTVFERHAKPGGMLRYAIPSHRLSEEFLDREVTEIRSAGVGIQCGRAVQGPDALQELLAEGYKAVYVATGAWKPQRLRIPGSDCAEVVDALVFLKEAREKPTALRKRVKGRNVAIIGGGDTAMDAAVTASLAGAPDVSVVYRRSFLEMPGGEAEKLAAFRKGIHFLMLTQPLEYHQANGKLAGMRVVRCRLGKPDQSGRRSPEPIPGTEHVIPVELVVEAVGFLCEGGAGQFKHVGTEAGNRVKANPETAETTAARVFAGGDAVRGPSLVSHAVCDGKKAAASIRRLLLGEVAS